MMTTWLVLLGLAVLQGAGQQPVSPDRAHTGVIRGRITDRETGQPLARAIVRLTRLGSQEALWLVPTTQAFTDSPDWRPVDTTASSRRVSSAPTMSWNLSRHRPGNTVRLSWQTARCVRSTSRCRARARSPFASSTHGAIRWGGFASS
jgi:hypothetical protein